MSERSKSRRAFIKSAAALSGASLISQDITSSMKTFAETNQAAGLNRAPVQIIIGNYGRWAAALQDDPPELSFRNNRFQDLNDWQRQALDKTYELVSPPPLPNIPELWLSLNINIRVWKSRNCNGSCLMDVPRRQSY